MGLRLFNTLTRSVQEFVPLDPSGKKVGMYCCGPTVYDYGHIGNFRTFVFADLVRRYLDFRGYDVNHVMNVTDVEDKIIACVREANTTLADYTRRYEEAFLEDSRVLNLLPPRRRPRATEHIGPIIGLIRKLEHRGFAYQAGDGSVYFSIEKYRAAGHSYGRLTKLNFEEMRAGERVKNDEYGKESVADFALWKARVPEDGEVYWPSPWGEGRPGWHIECSAMGMRLLGPSFDLHLGGEDLIFPHHEDEIAQSEGGGEQHGGQPFVKYWLHGAHLLVEGKKMSKSLGNFFTLRDLLGQGFTGREIRYLLLTAHYRESFNFTLDGLRGAKTSLARLDECVGKLRDLAGGQAAEPALAVVESFTHALDEDLNISAGWAVVFDWIRDQNRAMESGKVSAADAAGAASAWQRIDAVLGLGSVAKAPAPERMIALAEERQAARQAKDFARADAIRQELKAEGWLVEDTPQGPKLKRV